jgi:hypothetical protein
MRQDRTKDASGQQPPAPATDSPVPAKGEGKQSKQELLNTLVKPSKVHKQGKDARPVASGEWVELDLGNNSPSATSVEEQESGIAHFDQCNGMACKAAPHSPVKVLPTPFLCHRK